MITCVYRVAAGRQVKHVKVLINNQKSGDVRPAQMKHNRDKMPITSTSSQACIKPMLAAGLV
jgi:hypothetical protein